MTTRLLSKSAGVLLLALCLSAPAARAAAIELTVREQDGPPLFDIAVGLSRVSDASGTAASPLPRGDRPRARTDLDGKAVFEGLEPGTYRILIGRVPASIVVPWNNPFASVPTATLEREGDRVSVEVELPRGTEVTVEVVSDSGDPPRGRVRSREIYRGKEISTGSLGGGVFEETLAAGVWEVSFETESGQLLVGLEHDGVPLPGDRVILDLLEDRRDTIITYHFSAPSRLSGQLRYAGSTFGGVEILATLAEPGPWIDAARERGRVVDRVIVGHDPRTFDYGMVLPDGVWDVRPVGEVLLSSVPESRRVTLLPGQETCADFTVLREEGDDGAALEIRVLAPDGQTRSGALVEAWASGSRREEGQEPAVTAESGYGGRARLSGLRSGDYRIVAGHPDFADAEIRVDDFDSEGRTRREKLTLELGGVIHARARDETGQPLPGATLHLERLSDPPPSLLASERVREAKRTRAAKTDTTGVAHLAGIDVGEYRLRAELGEADAATGFALVSLPGKSGERELELELDENSRQDVEIGVRPAGSLAGRLVCRDRGALPATVAFQIRAPGDREGEDPRTILAVEGWILQGRLRDGFQVGPLEEGAYLLAVQPAGHEMWTFAPGTPDPEEASPLQVIDGEGLDLGTVEIYCGPVIVLTEDRDAEDRGPCLDLRRAALRSDLLVEVEPGREEPIRPEQRSSAEHVLLWDLPPGKAALDLEIDHPHFLEPRPRRVSRELELERGRASTVPLPPGGLGGTIRVPGPGEAARALDETGVSVTASILEGRAELTHLAPGTWRVATCEDATCEVLLREWSPVLVDPCSDTELRRSEGRPPTSGP